MPRIRAESLPLLVTCFICVLLYAVAAMKFDNFFSVAVLRDMVTDNAFLGIAAVGMTFVILTGGIDLSVGAVIACSSTIVALLVEMHKWHPASAIGLMLACGALFGAAMGTVITYFKLPPFLVTLGGMFLARGAGLVISSDQIPISNQLLSRVSDLGLYSGEDLIVPLIAWVFLATVFVGMLIAHFTVFGRTVYAVGGNEEASHMMGLRVNRTKIGVYSLSGFCSALAGVVYTCYTLSGNSSSAVGLELDAIAAVVIGGTLLTGGVGYVFGSFVGVLIFGIIQTSITFQASLSAWWTRIVIAALVLLFILLQKAIIWLAARRLSANASP